ncbi:MAG: HlyD family type I secretion periplasmic adaptor subunit [Paracoccaceae bacterium]
MRRADHPGDGALRPVVAALAVFGLVALAVAAWASLAPVASAVIAPGEIRVEGERKTVQHLEGGIVAAIEIAEGERVEAGEALVRLDTTEAEAERASLMAERDALEARALRLRAELAGRVPDFSALEGIGRASMAVAVESQRALFEARRREREAEAEMTDGTLVRLAQRVEAIRAERDGLEAQLALAEEGADATRALAERGVMSRAARRERERDVAGLGGARAALDARLSEATAAAAEERLKRVEADTRRVAATSEELSDVVARLAEIEPALVATEERIARAALRAPASGVVVGLSVATVGGVVAPGERLMDIVPASATLIAEARVDPADRERLGEGMTVEVRVAGQPRRADASVAGRVARLSADRIEGDGAEGEAHYAMTVALGGVPDGIDLAPGMPVTAIVPTRSRSVLDYLVAPIADALARSMREE